MMPVTQFLLRDVMPRVCGLLTRLLYWSSSVKVGRKFRADSIPRILIDRGARLEIGDGVELRRNVEIRVHGSATLSIGHSVRIDRAVRLLAANQARVEIGDGARIGLNTVFNGGDSISVGKKALISGFVYLQTSMHTMSEGGSAIQDQGFSHAPVSLGDDTWLGAHVVVLPGVTIGEGAVVGSNAVVTSNVAPRTVVAGVPARPINNRKE